MAEAQQYTVAHRELIELIIKSTGVHEGRWSLSINFNIQLGLLGTTPELTNPGVMLTIPNIGIQRQVAGAPEMPGAIIVDAAEVNPK